MEERNPSCINKKEETKQYLIGLPFGSTIGILFNGKKPVTAKRMMLVLVL